MIKTLYELMKFWIKLTVTKIHYYLFGKDIQFSGAICSFHNCYEAQVRKIRGNLIPTSAFTLLCYHSFCCLPASQSFRETLGLSTEDSSHWEPLTGGFSTAPAFRPLQLCCMTGLRCFVGTPLLCQTGTDERALRPPGLRKHSRYRLQAPGASSYSHSVGL